MFRHHFKTTDQLYAIGCAHLQHRNITRGISQWDVNTNMTRDFQTVEEMTAEVLRSIQAVPVDAHLFILGDFLFGNKKNIYDIVDSIPCKNLYYLFGNHCEWMRDRNWDNQFSWYGDYLEIFWGHQLVCLFHYPISVWNESHRGSWMVCSHSHGSFGPSRPETLDQGKILDVGWDVFHRPVDFNEISGIMAQKKAHNPDHHNPRTT